jgi:uncharacterized membrane protein
VGLLLTPVLTFVVAVVDPVRLVDATAITLDLRFQRVRTRRVRGGHYGFNIQMEHLKAFEVLLAVSAMLHVTFIYHD